MDFSVIQYDFKIYTSRIPLRPAMDSFQERKHKNFQVESDPFFGHLWNQTLNGLTKPGRHFGLGASLNSLYISLSVLPVVEISATFE